MHLARQIIAFKFAQFRPPNALMWIERLDARQRKVSNQRVCESELSDLQRAHKNTLRPVTYSL